MKTVISIIIVLVLIIITTLLLVSVESNKESKEIDKIYEDEYVKTHTKS